MKKSALQRFMRNIQQDKNGCWLWQRSLSKGYAKFNEHGKTIYAHIWIYKFLYGNIPEGLEIDHTCRVRSCVNPQHLEAVTCIINNRRKFLDANNAPCMLNTHCVNGHLLDKNNTYTGVFTKGPRKGKIRVMCKQCHREQSLKYHNKIVIK